MIATTIDPRLLLIVGLLAIGTLVVLDLRWRSRVRNIHSWLEEAERNMEMAGDALPDECTRQITTLSAYCLDKPDVYRDSRFGQNPLTLHVGGSMFALIGGGSLLLKCAAEQAKYYREKFPAVTPGYQLGAEEWNTVRCNGSIPEAELKNMIDHAYALVCKDQSVQQQTGGQRSRSE
ncbi:MmcQ/YjbR family DNA-binding protein [Paenibacillus sp. GCM10027626]|uniref:MmcQ/YjbR family DNA-binding protein n=1 Tax=Paenibacillus sp. GCM10027626 TaxID=3273411 RepID=UPI00363300D8